MRVRYKDLPVDVTFIRDTENGVLWIKTFGLWAVRLDKMHLPHISLSIDGNEIVTVVDKYMLMGVS